MLSITFDDVSHPSLPLRHGYDLELRVDANIQIADALGVFFEEPQFSIVELRSELQRWVASGPSGDLNFVSVDAEEDPLIYFRETQDGWEVGSPWSERSGRATGGAVIAASSAFVRDVDTWVRDNLGISDVDAFLKR